VFRSHSFFNFPSFCHFIERAWAMLRFGLVTFTTCLVAGLLFSAAAHGSTLSEQEIQSIEQAAGMLLQKGKYDAARAVYTKLVAADPTSATAARGHRRIAESFVAEDEPLQAVEYLGEILHEGPRLPLPETQGLVDLLVQLRTVRAKRLAELRKYDKANEMLQPIVADRRMPTANVRAAWRTIAANWHAGETPAGATAAYERLLALRDVSDQDRLADILAYVTFAPEEVHRLALFAQEHPVVAVEPLARTRHDAGHACWQAGRHDLAYEQFATIINDPQSPAHWVRTAYLAAVDLLLEDKNPDEAIEQLHRLLDRPFNKDALGDRLSDINRLVRLDRDGNYVELVGEYLSHLPNLGGLTLSEAAPPNDVLLVGTSGNLNEILDRFKLHLRASTGRVDGLAMERLAKHLQEGSAARPFETSAFSRAVAEEISADAPLAGYLRPLLSGNYQTAAKYAWLKARGARHDAERLEWLQGVAIAVRCEDQSRAGRAEAFWKWATAQTPAVDEEGQRQADPNPLHDYLGMDQLAPRATEEEIAAAARHLNTITEPGQLAAHELVSRVLADNDCALLAIENVDGMVQHLRRYQWQSEGRALPQDLERFRQLLTTSRLDGVLAVSEVSRELAAKITDDAPLADYLQPLLAGEFAEAAQAAWKRARLVRDPHPYDLWLAATGMALRCRAQTYLAEKEFLDWARSPDLEAAENPVPEVLTLEPLPFRANAIATKAALEALNRVQVHEITQVKLQEVLPDNDMLLLATTSVGDALEQYRKHLRRTEGRVRASQIAAVEKRLKECIGPAPFIVSPESLRLAEQVSDQAPLADFWRTLLAGKSRDAAQLAWASARTARSDPEYRAWIAAVALAVRCHEQCIEAGPQAFLQWTDGALVDGEGRPVYLNPAAKVLGE
jgi:tetratricopeptide (TPR) repeat protein